MRRLIAAGIAFAWLSAQPLAPMARDASEEPQFQPPEAVSVSDVTPPFSSIACGTVVMDVRVSEKGEVTDIEVRRAIPSLTEGAVRSVRAWTFEPARFNGQAVISRITVAITLNPASEQGGTPSLPPLIHQDDQSRIQSSFQPPEVTFSTLPRYPHGATPIAPTVALEATINKAGKVNSTRVLRDVPPFTATAIQAVGDWKFVPATWDGRPLESKVVLAFSFRQPVSGPTGPPVNICIPAELACN